MIRTIFLERAPLVRLRRSGLNIGNARTGNPQVKSLYDRMAPFLSRRSLWQGAFELACLTTEDPLHEPVTALIRRETEGSQNGAFHGSFTEQLQLAKAALDLAEFTADRGLMKRLAEWCRWVEVNWDQIISLQEVRVQPADLMEFLIRFYLMTSSQAALRLCARLRSGAMDWTTALQSYSSVGRLKNNMLTEKPQDILSRSDLDETDWQKRLCILNHGELVADGMRFAALAGLFSGNGQELSAGFKGWKAVQKSDGAVCGGTCGAPFLSGRGSAQPVSTAVLSAWVEALAAQLYITEAAWPLDGMIRIGLNGLQEALRDGRPAPVQRVNRLKTDPAPETAPAEGEEAIRILGRAARAVSVFYRWAVGVSADALHLHYPLPGKYLIPGRKMVVTMGPRAARIRVRDGSDLSLTVFAAGTETREILIHSGSQLYSFNQSEADLTEIREGKTFATGAAIQDQDRVEWAAQDAVRYERTHHQGICFWTENQMRVLDAGESWRYAATGRAEKEKDGSVRVEAVPVEDWRIQDQQPAEIPVLPRGEGKPVMLKTVPYEKARNRIAVFPRAAKT